MIKFMILFLVSFSAYSTEIYLGFGVPYNADKVDSNIYSVSIERNEWKVDYSYWQGYTRSSWDTDKHPTWDPYKIKSHSIFSVSTNIYQYEFDNKCNFYVDFGLAYTTDISRATSSSVLFHEAIGYQCGWWKLEVNHNSNAGLKGHNVGGDAASIKILILKF